MMDNGGECTEIQVSLVKEMILNEHFRGFYVERQTNLQNAVWVKSVFGNHGGYGHKLNYIHRTLLYISPACKVDLFNFLVII